MKGSSIAAWRADPLRIKYENTTRRIRLDANTHDLRAGKRLRCCDKFLFSYALYYDALSVQPVLHYNEGSRKNNPKSICVATLDENGRALVT